MTVWFNGAFTNGEALIAADDRGFLLGDGAFETIAVRDGRLEFWSRHYNRLTEGLRVLGIAPLPSLKETPAIANDLYEKNGAPACAALRVTVSRGRGPRGLAPSTDHAPSVLCALSAFHDGENAPRQIIVSTKYKRHVNVFSSFKHVAGYGANIAALAEAHAAGAEDALLLNDAGQLACATTANIFVIKPDGVVATPRLEDGAMPGVVRAVLLESLGDAAARALDPDALIGAALVLTNSLIGVKRACMMAGLMEEKRASELTAAQTSAIDDLCAVWTRARTADSAAGSTP
ncbi:MAG: aminotransferase class IV [Pseudomonadota bacterium]